MEPHCPAEREAGSVTFDEIERAIGQRLTGMASCPPVAWPNQDFTPNGTYIEFRHVPGDRVDDTVSGGFPFQTGVVLLTVVIRSGGFNTSANTIAQQVADRFPKALRLASTGGDVLMYAPAAFGTPFQDGAYWRQPVRVFYITEPS
jgi:hypothetical protein